LSRKFETKPTRARDSRRMESRLQPVEDKTAMNAQNVLTRFALRMPRRLKAGLQTKEENCQTNPPYLNRRFQDFKSQIVQEAAATNRSGGISAKRTQFEKLKTTMANYQTKPSFERKSCFIRGYRYLRQNYQTNPWRNRIREALLPCAAAPGRRSAPSSTCRGVYETNPCALRASSGFRVQSSKLPNEPNSPESRISGSQMTQWKHCPNML